MPTNFDVCIERVLAHEGGYKPATPEDPGGETNFGISKRSYPAIDIKNLTRAAAIEIYRSDFWTAIRGEELHLAIASPLLDFAVNSGPVPAIKALQSALGGKADGMFGPVTMDKAWSVSSGSALGSLLMRFSAARLRYLAGLKNWLPNSAGWVNRVAGNLTDGAADLA